jgi:hypothetical protein
MATPAACSSSASPVLANACGRGSPRVHVARHRQVRPGTRLGDIGHVIQNWPRARVFPWCANTAATASAACSTRSRRCCTTASRAPARNCAPGMTFTIEPMINAGKRHVKLLPDGWTVVTKDHSLSAQWEHTVLVTGHRLRGPDAGRRATGDAAASHDSAMVSTSRPEDLRDSSPDGRDRWRRSRPLLDRPRRLVERAGRARPPPRAARRRAAGSRQRFLAERAHRGAGARRARCSSTRSCARPGGTLLEPAHGAAWRWWPWAAMAAANCTPAPTSTS